MGNPKIVVIGGGSTGSFITHDLASRGFDVTLIERGTVIGGTSGRFHGLLHSGARYAVNDPKAARESLEDNGVISRIASHSVEDTGGFFVGIDDEDVSYASKFAAGCKEAGIDAKEVDIEELRKSEPLITKDAKIAFSVPDKTINSFSFITSLMLTAKSEGAKVRLNSEVTGFDTNGKEVKGVKIRDVSSGKTETITSDLVVNASGPWVSDTVKKSLGIDSIKLILSAGTMTVIGRRFTTAVINRLRMPSDGDIIVPYHGESIIGTTAFLILDPDNFEIDEDDPKFLVEEGSKLVPEIGKYQVKRYYAGVRPLIASEGGGAGQREVSRDYVVFDHESLDGVRGIMSVGGGKLSTSRILAKDVGDFVRGKFGGKAESRTDSINLVWPELGADNFEKIAKDTGFPVSFLKELVYETSSKTYSDIYSPVRDLVYSKMLFD